MPLFIISPILIFIFGFIIGLVVGTKDKRVTKDELRPNVKTDDDFYNSDDFWAYAKKMKNARSELKDFRHNYHDKNYNVEVLFNRKSPIDKSYFDYRTVGDRRIKEVRNYPLTHLK